MIDQLVIIAGTVHAKSIALRGSRHANGFGQAGVDLPIFHVLIGYQFQQTRLFSLTLNGQQGAGAIKESMGLINMRAAYGQVPGVDLVLHTQGALAGFALPAVIVQLADGNRFVAREGGYAFDLTREVADQVAAGNPGRKAQDLAICLGEVICIWTVRRWPARSVGSAR